MSFKASRSPDRIWLQGMHPSALAQIELQGDSNEASEGSCRTVFLIAPISCQVMTILPILFTRSQLSLLSNTETLLLGTHIIHTWQAPDIE